MPDRAPLIELQRVTEEHDHLAQQITELHAKWLGPTPPDALGGA